MANPKKPKDNLDAIKSQDREESEEAAFSDKEAAQEARTFSRLTPTEQARESHLAHIDSLNEHIKRLAIECARLNGMFEQFQSDHKEEISRIEKEHKEELKANNEKEAQLRNQITQEQKGSHDLDIKYNRLETLFGNINSLVTLNTGCAIVGSIIVGIAGAWPCSDDNKRLITTIGVTIVVLSVLLGYVILRLNQSAHKSNASK